MQSAECNVKRAFHVQWVHVLCVSIIAQGSPCRGCSVVSKWFGLLDSSLLTLFCREVMGMLQTSTAASAVRISQTIASWARANGRVL